MAPKVTGAFPALREPFLDAKGQVSWVWLKQLQQWQLLLAGGFDPSGTLIANLSPNIKIVGRLGTIGTILQHIDALGVVESSGLFSATDVLQGAVILPTGAGSNVLGSAAIQPSTAFDPAGAAAAAQTNAQTFATGAAATAQANAALFSSDASNLTSGNVNLARIPGLAGAVTIVTAKLTLAGANGSMDFMNGVLVSQVAAT